MSEIWIFLVLFFMFELNSSKIQFFLCNLESKSIRYTKIKNQVD